MLDYLYTKMSSLETMSAFYRYYFLKLSEFHYEREKIYPFHNYFPQYSNVVKFHQFMDAE